MQDAGMWLQSRYFYQQQEWRCQQDRTPPTLLVLMSVLKLNGICLERPFSDVRVYHAQAPFNRNLKTIPTIPSLGYIYIPETRRDMPTMPEYWQSRADYSLVFLTSGEWGRLVPYLRGLQQRWPLRPVRIT